VLLLISLVGVTALALAQRLAMRARTDARSDNPG